MGVHGVYVRVGLPNVLRVAIVIIVTYCAQVIYTVAIVLRKEQLGLQMIQERERVQGWDYTWILLMREDAHWFRPFRR
jgi:hypothetical protein